MKKSEIRKKLEKNKTQTQLLISFDYVLQTFAIVGDITKNVLNGFYLYFIKDNNKKAEFVADEELAKFYVFKQITALSYRQFKLVEVF